MTRQGSSRLVVASRVGPCWGLLVMAPKDMTQPATNQDRLRIVVSGPGALSLTGILFGLAPALVAIARKDSEHDEGRQPGVDRRGGVAATGLRGLDG